MPLVVRVGALAVLLLVTLGTPSARAQEAPAPMTVGASCEDDWDCRLGLRCDAGVCVADPEAGRVVAPARPLVAPVAERIHATRAPAEAGRRRRSRGHTYDDMLIVSLSGFAAGYALQGVMALAAQYELGAIPLAGGFLLVGGGRAPADGRLCIGGILSCPSPTLAPRIIGMVGSLLQIASVVGFVVAVWPRRQEPAAAQVTLRGDRVELTIAF